MEEFDEMRYLRPLLVTTVVALLTWAVTDNYSRRWHYQHLVHDFNVDVAFGRGAACNTVSNLRAEWEESRQRRRARIAKIEKELDKMLPDYHVVNEQATDFWLDPREIEVMNKCNDLVKQALAQR